jgi:hypothetical protein
MYVCKPNTKNLKVVKSLNSYVCAIGFQKLNQLHDFKIQYVKSKVAALLNFSRDIIVDGLISERISWYNEIEQSSSLYRTIDNRPIDRTTIKGIDEIL